MNAGPAPGVFHSAAGQASAAAASSTGKAAPARQVAVAAAMASAAATSSAASAAAESPASDRCGSPRTIDHRRGGHGNECDRRQAALQGGAIGADHRDDSPPIGSSASSRVPAPGGLATDSVPPSASTRSASPRRPEPRAASAPPGPSSTTRTTSRGPIAATAIRTPDASAYFATLARPSEHTKKAAASCGRGKAPVRHVEDHRDGRLVGELAQRRMEALLGQRARVHALREACKIGTRGVELGHERAECGGRLALAAGGERRKVVRYLAETLLGAAAQLLAEAAALLVAGLDEPAARGGDVADALGDVGLQAHVGQRQPHRGGDRSRERLVAQRRRVVHERGHRRAAVVHDRDLPRPRCSAAGSCTGRPASSTHCSPTR